MAVVLAFTKGRSSDPLLLWLTRKLAGLSFAAGVRIYSRWIPSEGNPSDAASRWFDRIVDGEPVAPRPKVDPLFDTDDCEKFDELAVQKWKHSQLPLAAGDDRRHSREKGAGEQTIGFGAKPQSRSRPEADDGRRHPRFIDIEALRGAYVRRLSLPSRQVDGDGQNSA